MRRFRESLADGFGSASRAERREADLFFADLVGHARRRARAFPSAAAPVREDEDGGDDWGETFTPENLAPDMAGLEFQLAAAGNVTAASGAPIPLPAGTVVTVAAWDNAKDTIEGTIAGTKFTVGKELLATRATMVANKVTARTRAYDVAVPLYAARVASLRAEAVKAKAAGGSPSLKQLNKHLIIETMLNRNDSLIAKWTVSYDALIGEAKGWPPLAPGWVKSMMVQESTAGTAGIHLEEKPGGGPLKTRFNVLQAIDSWGPQQFHMMQEIEPGLLKREGMDTVLDDQRALAREWDALEAKPGRSVAESARLKELDGLKFADPVARKSPTWSRFFELYPDVALKAKAGGRSGGGGTGTTSTTTTGTGTGTGASGTKRRYWDVVVAFLEAGTPKRKYSYDFWIRTGVRWLFEKRLESASWSDAVRSYNGTGGRAEFYRAIVLTRARAAAAVAGITEDIWGGFRCDGKAKTPGGVFQLCPFEQVAQPCEPRC